MVLAVGVVMVVVVAAVEGQRTRLVAEPIWLDRAWVAQCSFVNSGLQRRQRAGLDTVNHQNKSQISAEKGK